ncbi:MAG: hypothetical protein ABJG78_09115 [Cyclobacteriaceae bacterium]
MIIWILHIILIGALGLVVYRATKNELSALIFSTALGLRVVASMIAAFIFYNLYPGDSITFYESAKNALNNHSIWSIITGDFVSIDYSRQPRVLFFIQILSAILVLSGGSYWIASLYFALISFTASTYFVVQFGRLFPSLKRLSIALFLFMPSVLFWSSGILKDTISYSAFVIVVALILKVQEGVKVRWFELLIGILSLFVLFKIKHYLLIISFLFAGVTLSISWFRKLNGIWKWVVAVPTLLILFTMTQFVHPYLKIGRIPQTIYENNQIIIEKTNDKNQLDIAVEKPEWMAVLKEIPSSLYAGLFRPTIFDKTPPLGIVHKVENLALVSLIFLTLLSWSSLKPKVNWRLILPAIFCISVLATLLAMTTPNLGSLIRYRNAYLPFLFLILGILPFQYLTSRTS